MPYNPANKGLNGHPMLHKLVQAHLDGQSSREIAKWIHPPVSHVTISRHITNYIIPVMGNAEKIKAMLGFNGEANAGLPPALQCFTTALQVDQLARQTLTAVPVLTMREGRIAAQSDRHRRMAQVIEERAADMAKCRRCGHLEVEHPYQGVRPDGSINECPEYFGVPGGRTGLMVEKVKANGGVEYAVDTALLSELREHEKHIAIESGQWQENVGGSSVSVQIICPQAPDGSLPRVSFASSDTVDLDAGESIGLLQRPV